METIKTQALLDLQHSAAGKYIGKYEYPHEAIPHIKEIIYELIKTIDKTEFYSPCEGVWISNDAEVAPSACIMPPTLIMPDAQIRHCAFIRGSVIVGCGCVVGNSTELKNCILFDRVDVPHFNYVGDSILGYHAHMGAGAIISNIKSDKTNVVIRCGTQTLKTGLRKMGAIVGDHAEIGCNSVLNPGTVVGRRCTIYPTSCVRGVIAEDSIYKNAGSIVIKTKRERD